MLHSGVGTWGEGSGWVIAIPMVLKSCNFIVKKKTLLLSVCEGNENLMRLDFFFSPFSVRSHSALDSTTGSPRRSTRDGRNA